MCEEEVTRKLRAYQNPGIYLLILGVCVQNTFLCICYYCLSSVLSLITDVYARKNGFCNDRRRFVFDVIGCRNRLCREAPTTLRESFHSADSLLRCWSGLNRSGYRGCLFVRLTQSTCCSFFRALSPVFVITQFIGSQVKTC